MSTRGSCSWTFAPSMRRWRARTFQKQSSTIQRRTSGANEEKRRVMSRWPSSGGTWMRPIGNPWSTPDTIRPRPRCARIGGCTAVFLLAGLLIRGTGDCLITQIVGMHRLPALHNEREKEKKEEKREKGTAVPVFCQWFLQLFSFRTLSFAKP